MGSHHIPVHLDPRQPSRRSGRALALALAVAASVAACAPTPSAPPDAAAASIGPTASASATGAARPRSPEAPAPSAEAATDVASWLELRLGAAPIVVIDDWWAAIDGGDPAGEVTANLGLGGNSMRVLPSTLERPQRRWSIDVAYGITQEAPHDFVGFDRDLAALQDWSGAERVLVDVDLTRAPDIAWVFQFREASGEVWRHQAPASEVAPGEPAQVPLDLAHFRRAEWSTQVNEAIDLGAIDRYGVYFGHAGAGKVGTATLGAIAAYRR